MAYAQASNLQSVYNAPRPSWLLAAAAFAIILIPITFLLLTVDPRVLDDEALWLKPMKFQLSMAVLCATVLGALRSMPQAVQSNLWLVFPARLIAATAIFELTFLFIQAARGVRSHFNDDTVFDAVGGMMMAAGANFLVLAAMAMGAAMIVLNARRGWGEALSPVPLAFAVGLIVGGFLGGYTGSFLGMNGGPFVGLYLPEDPVLPLFGWSLTIGDLRIAHFFGLHAMQILPLVAVLASVLLPKPAVTVLVPVAAGVVIWITFQSLAVAQAGQPWMLF
jgi:hypothetical protein